MVQKRYFGWLLFGLFVIHIIIFSGCVIPIGLYQQHLRTTARQQYVSAHPDLNYRIKAAILNGQVVIGMKDDELLASWGRPVEINQSVGPWGIHEQWIYGRFPYNDTYIYLENGRVVSWQSRR